MRRNRVDSLLLGLTAALLMLTAALLVGCGKGEGLTGAQQAFWVWAWPGQEGIRDNPGLLHAYNREGGR